MQYPFETKHRVAYRDVDMQKVVNNSTYLHYAEIGRIEYLRSRGCPYQEVVEKFGIEIVLAESHCYFKQPARFDDLLSLQVGLAELGRSSLKIAYKIFRKETGELLTEIHTHHVCVDGKTFRPVRIPERLREIFEQDLITEEK